MGKVLECVYAYIYKNNYAGACSLGKQIYTLTEGLTARENDMLAGIMPTGQRLESSGNLPFRINKVVKAKTRPWV